MKLTGEHIFKNEKRMKSSNLGDMTQVELIEIGENKV